MAVSSSESTTGREIGSRCWVIAEGYIPKDEERDRRFQSHEVACILNASARDAHVSVTFYFVDREPAGPYAITVPARRTRHVRLNELTDEEMPPFETDYSSVFESDVPVVIQHTRLDSRRGSWALLSTVAYAG